MSPETLNRIDGPVGHSPAALWAASRAAVGARVLCLDFPTDENAVTHNPVKGVERPKTESGEGKTPAIRDHQARDLLAAPGEDTIKSKRDRAILSTLLFH